ncbi:MAG TPA: amidase family protein [Baekduia sp.]
MLFSARSRARTLGLASLAAALTAGALAAPAGAFNYVLDANGTYWGIQDAAAPRVDTGSVRATQVAPGNSGAYSTTISGFGGVKVWVGGSHAPRFNGELMRGYGLKFDGLDHFDTTQGIDLGGVRLQRSIWINRASDWGRWLDSFTNTTDAPITIKVAFGGQTGYGDPTVASGNPATSAIVNTSSADTTVGPDDDWVEVATPFAALNTTANPPTNPATTLVGGPQATVLGTPSPSSSPFAGAMSFSGDWLYDTFNNPLATSGHEGNFQAYVNTITIPAGKSRSVLHYVVLGGRVNSTTSAAVRTSVEATATTLAATPDLTGLSTAQICSIDNFDIASMTIAGFDDADCAGVGTVGQVPVPDPRPKVTSSPYDVVGKTIDQEQDDMEAGRTTSQRITRAYLDRIAAYDQGQFGFNAFEYVAKDAMEQAKAADDARAAGKTGRLLGIPIGVKNLYDTKDMPTTNGSLTFEGFQPAKDAFQVGKLRSAGAVIIGKTALEEYATSGNYSNDPWGQVWNAFNPSKSAIASSGGSATATALSLDAAALGSQTGDSLYGPSSGASLVSLRGTDGLESGSGIMPLGFLTDFGGAIARSVPDLADILDVVAGTDPADPTSAPADSHLPKDWRDTLDVNALQGKRIGYIPSTFVDPFGTTGTTDAEKAALQYLTDAGATIVPMGTTVGGTDAPTAPTDPTTPALVSNQLNYEGWDEYIDKHPELGIQGFPYTNGADVACSQKKIAYVRNDPASATCTNTARLTADQLASQRAYRVTKQQTLATWMDHAGADGQGVDAVVYPGLLSDISLNDGGGGKSSFGRRDTPSATFGSPTVIFPAGYNDHGQPINLQLLGRAWDDPKLVGMAYAFEHYAEADGNGHQEPTTAPALKYEPGAEPVTITEEKPVPSEPVVTTVTTTVTQPGPAGPTPVKVTLTVPKSGRVVNGLASLALYNTSKVAVSGSVTLKGAVKGHTKAVTFGTVSFSLPAGKHQTVRVYLGPTARKAIRGHKAYTVTATYALHNSTGATLATHRSVRLTVSR